MYTPQKMLSRIRRLPALLAISACLASNSYAIDIMPLGDSITHGYNSCSYRTPLIEGLGSCDFTMVGTQSSPINPPPGCSVANANHEGHGGWRTVHYVQLPQPSPNNLDSFLNANVPDVVLMNIGTNDMGTESYNLQVGTYNTSTNQGTFTIGRIVEMIDTIFAKNNSATIFIADLIPRYDDSAINTRVIQLRAQINAMVSDRRADGDDIILTEVSSGYSPSMMQSDQIHPNETGDQHIALTILKALHDDGICTPMPFILSPTTTTLQGPTQSFTWTINNINDSYVERWELKAGSSQNSGNFATASGNGYATQATLTGLPTSGETVHVTLRIKYYTGEWFTQSRVHTAVDYGNDPSTCPSTMSAGNLRYGVAAQDNATGSGWLMWSETSVHNRFSPSPHPDNADHFIAVKHVNGQWMVDHNNGLSPFTPAPTDCLIADVNFSAGTVNLLQSSSGRINGIDSGFSNSDLYVEPNRWNGNRNRGEFYLTGSYLSDAGPAPTNCPSNMAAGNLRYGVAAQDNATGSGWLMWSETSVHNRFSSNPHPDNAEHFIAVKYVNGQWMVDHNNGLSPFTPAPTDCLIADVNFSAGTVNLLQSSSGRINGIDSGFSNSDLHIEPNHWNGKRNRGEFYLTGSFVSH